MLNKLKTITAAVAFAALPMMAAATPLDFNEGGSTLIELGNTYGYAETGITAGPDSRNFTLNATPPSAIGLETEFNTLEFTGTFTNLMIFLTRDSGVVNATEILTAGTSRLFELSTVFNTDVGFEQVLTVSWDAVTGSQAGFLIQATPSAVPVPAAGLLLLTAIGGAAALRRRKKAVTA